MWKVAVSLAAFALAGCAARFEQQVFDGWNVVTGLDGYKTREVRDSGDGHSCVVDHGPGGMKTYSVWRGRERIAQTIVRSPRDDVGTDYIIFVGHCGDPPFHS